MSVGLYISICSRFRCWGRVTPLIIPPIWCIFDLVSCLVFVIVPCVALPIMPLTTPFIPLVLPLPGWVDSNISAIHFSCRNRIFYLLICSKYLPLLICQKYVTESIVWLLSIYTGLLYLMILLKFLLVPPNVIVTCTHPCLLGPRLPVFTWNISTSCIAFILHICSTIPTPRCPYATTVSACWLMILVISPEWLLS